MNAIFPQRPAEILAHQGGWDEILLVAAPLAVFGGALWLANRRANAKLAERALAGGQAIGPDAAKVTDDQLEDPAT